ncbi:MAG: DUF3109 family protein [Muribaculaceae bacterium]|nr:DUF3109 family protein [Muribaculaceae bacterium]
MLEIQNTLVTLDLIERFFCCDLSRCLGQCCIEGDAGAPVTPAEVELLKEVLPEVWDDLSPEARRVIEEQGVSYVDEEGDLVTSIVNGRDCVFTCYAEGGLCLCAIEKAYREGRVKWRKPISCALYPVRLTEYDGFTAVNLHRWKICKCAEVLGRREGLRAYQFLHGPLIDRFGQEWYDELAATAEEYLRQRGASMQR